MCPMQYGRPGLPGPRTLSAKLAIALIAGSVLFALTRGSFGNWLLLSPGLVLSRLAFWQVGTYAFVETSPFAVLIDAFVIWSIGSGLELTWGRRRLLGYALLPTLGAGALTVLLALFITPMRALIYTGGTVVVSSLWVAYGLAFGKQQLNFVGIPLSGNGFAWLGVGFIALNAAFSSFWVVIPDALAVGAVFASMRLESPRRLWLRFGAWRVQQKMRGRAKKLRLITRDRNTPTDSDRYLH